jgi:hypothetical protein
MRSSDKGLITGVIVALVVGLCFAGSFLTAFHSPRPQHLPVAAAGPSSAVRHLESGLASHAPGAFSIRHYPSPATARAAVADRITDGAVLLGAHRIRLLVADAGGTGSAEAITSAVTEAAAASGMQVTVSDIKPLPASNREGLTVFFLALALLVSSLAAGVITTFTGRAASVRHQAAALAIFAVAVGLATIGMAEGILGALPGHFLPLVGVAALLSTAISVPTAALARLAPPAAGLAALTFLVVGVPASGGPAGLGSFLPTFYRVLGAALPLGVAVRALTDITYFDGHDISGRLVILGVWAAGGLIVLVATAGLRATRIGAPNGTGGSRPEPGMGHGGVEEPA